MYVYAKMNSNNIVNRILSRLKSWKFS
jgi:hypothetical protein